MPYPMFEDQIKELVKEHLELEDQPLLVALYYASDIAPNEECLFEVARHFGFDEVSEEHEIFQIKFGPTDNFPLPSGDRLRLLLTNAEEFKEALSQNWPEIQDLEQAIHRNQTSLLYYRKGDRDAEDIVDALRLPVLVA